MTLPTDTIIDTDPVYEEMGEDMCENARIVMKAIYLLHPMADEMRDQGWSDTHIIDAAETLRRKGLIKIIEDQGEFRIEIVKNLVT